MIATLAFSTKGGYMVAFRKKTRSDEQVSPADFTPGLTVWVQNGNGNGHGREMRICTGPHGELLTPAEHERRKVEHAAANRRVFSMTTRRKRSDRTSGHLPLW